MTVDPKRAGSVPSVPRTQLQPANLEGPTLKYINPAHAWQINLTKLFSQRAKRSSKKGPVIIEHELELTRDDRHLYHLLLKKCINNSGILRRTALLLPPPPPPR